MQRRKIYTERLIMKNTKAKFSNKIKEQIYERDWKCCIICWCNQNLQLHHVYYGNQSNRWKNRNDVDQGVTICAHHHLEAHSCASWEWVRQKCIDYLNNLV